MFVFFFSSRRRHTRWTGDWSSDVCSSDLNSGESPETICQNFELLRLEEVYGAIAYYLANQAEIDAYVVRQSEKWAEGKRNAEPLPANLREKLMRARDQ